MIDYNTMIVGNLGSDGDICIFVEDDPVDGKRYRVADWHYHILEDTIQTITREEYFDVAEKILQNVKDEVQQINRAMMMA